MEADNEGESPLFSSLPSNPHPAAGSLWNNCTKETLPCPPGERQRDSEPRFPAPGGVRFTRAISVGVSLGKAAAGESAGNARTSRSSWQELVEKSWESVIPDITPAVSRLCRTGQASSPPCRRSRYSLDFWSWLGSAFFVAVSGRLVECLPNDCCAEGSPCPGWSGLWRRGLGRGVHCIKSKPPVTKQPATLLE